MGDKKAVKKAVKCTNFHVQAKTVLIAGGSGKNLGGAAGQPLEIVPVTDLRSLKAGGELVVTVLSKGKPLSDATLNATYAGFESKDKDLPKPSAEGKKTPRMKRHYPAQAHTDAQGKAILQLKSAGYWMILLSHHCPFDDPAICDEYMYKTAFTFQVPE